MKSFSTLSYFSLLILHPEWASAYWRMACSVSQTARADPILNPGAIAGHVHKFAGGNAVTENATYETLQTSTCSSCEVQADKSAYWTPQLYFAHMNGTVEEVPNYGMTVYYVGRGGNSSNTVPYPEGFRMISGTSAARSYDNETLTYLDTRPVADRHYIFNTTCVNGFRAQLNFQSCWDGVNLYLEDSAHVAYLSGIDYGVCPPSHPVPIPGLFFEVLYMTNMVDQSAGGEFVFSNGDPTGYGFHGDFMNGWDMDVQTSAVEDCLYLATNGLVSECPVLAPVDDLNFPRDCPEEPSVFSEPVHGLLAGLPGCNPITYGPASSPQQICPLNTTLQTTDTGLENDLSLSLIASATFNSALITSTSSLPAPTSSVAPFVNITMSGTTLVVNITSTLASTSTSGVALSAIVASIDAAALSASSGNPMTTMTSSEAVNTGTAGASIVNLSQVSATSTDSIGEVFVQVASTTATGSAATGIAGSTTSSSDSVGDVSTGTASTSSTESNGGVFAQASSTGTGMTDVAAAGTTQSSNTLVDSSSTGSSTLLSGASSGSTSAAEPTNGAAVQTVTTTEAGSTMLSMSTTTVTVTEDETVTTTVYATAPPTAASQGSDPATSGLAIDPTNLTTNDGSTTPSSTVGGQLVGAATTTSSPGVTATTATTTFSPNADDQLFDTSPSTTATYVITTDGSTTTVTTVGSQPIEPSVPTTITYVITADGSTVTVTTVGPQSTEPSLPTTITYVITADGSTTTVTSVSGQSTQPSVATTFADVTTTDGSTTPTATAGDQSSDSSSSAPVATDPSSDNASTTVAVQVLGSATSSPGSSLTSTNPPNTINNQVVNPTATSNDPSNPTTSATSPGSTDSTTTVFSTYTTYTTIYPMTSTLSTPFPTNNTNTTVPSAPFPLFNSTSNSTSNSNSTGPVPTMTLTVVPQVKDVAGSGMVTAFVTMTQLFTDDVFTTTDVTASPVFTSFFTIRGREVVRVYGG